MTRTLLLIGAWTVSWAIPVHAAAEPVILETPMLRFSLSPDDGSYSIEDKPTEVTWRSNPFQPRLGEVALKLDNSVRRFGLSECRITKTEPGLIATFTPLAEKPGAQIRIGIAPGKDSQTLEFSYENRGGLQVESIRLLDDSLWVTDAEHGYLVVPVREGLLIPADSGLAFTHRFDTYAYEGCHMEMFGIVKNGATALITWEDPYVALDVRSALTNAPAAGDAKQILAPSVVLSKSARSFRVHFAGQGDYVSLAREYRRIASEKGWLSRWEDKLKNHPERAKLFGAINFKLWSALDRRMNEASTKEDSVRVNWTFDEAAQIAEHLKNDLKLEKVLFILGGWIRRGYDNQHPDVLPAAPECGGNDALADCAQRVRRLGYLFCLHDNYQDMYRDTPSWDESFLMKRPDGGIAAGGKWAGGRAYLTCSQKAVELAKRPQNLPAIQQLTRADAFFIDTTYAAGLMECFDRQHPLTRRDDLRWKQAISDYARDVFGIFGSECGREWAIPHSDFFEGLTGVSGRYYHDANLVSKLGAAVVPLFEMVYRDCIAMYGKYGYDPSKAAEYVLHHISLGRPLHYHNLPPHLYWNTQPTAASAGTSPDGADVFTCADRGWAEGLHRVDRFVKNTYEILSPLNELTSQSAMTRHEFLTPDRKVQYTSFGEGEGTCEVIVNASAKPYEHRSRFGKMLVLPRYGFSIESPTFTAFHSLSWNGRRYEAPVLFTLRSVDGKPLENSRQVRVYHGFGDDRIDFRGQTWSVQKEKVIEPIQRNGE
ncbi:MAG: hypothetical protein HYY23_01375 [Verrucomicrobia bacterium]|nr:hypothetical protein [Verrucomicrobiota bacterium]